MKIDDTQAQIKKHWPYRLLPILVLTFALAQSCFAGIDRIIASQPPQPIQFGDYTSAAVANGRIYAADSTGIDWVYLKNPVSGEWDKVRVMTGSYASITGASDGTLYGASTADGIYWIHWAGQWLSTKLVPGSYVSVAMNSNQSSGGLYAAGAGGGIDWVYWTGSQWAKTMILRGTYVSLAPDYRGNGAVFGVRSTGQVDWINYNGAWQATTLIQGNYISVSPDPAGSGNCRAIRADGGIDRISYNGSQWTATHVCAGSYKAACVDPAVSDTLYIVSPDNPTTAHAAVKLPDNSHIRCSGIVTAHFNEYFYVATSEYLGGIRVEMPSHPAVEGCWANLTGSIATLPSGERYARATSVELAPDHSPSSLFMSNRGIGGGDVIDLLAGFGQPGMSGGFGLNNIGTRITTSGTVLDKTDNDTLLLSDGSGQPVKAVHPWGFAGYSVVVGDYITATGVVSCELNQPGSNITPVLLLTDWKVQRKSAL